MIKKQWDLTDEEVVELKDRTVKRRGNYRMLEELQRLLGYEIEKELAWWEAVRLRLNIPASEKRNLITDHQLGKIWIRGEVPSLDKELDKRTLVHMDM